MKPITIVIFTVSIAVSFAAGYMTSTHHHRQEDEARRKEASKKAAVEFRKAEKSFDDLLQLPEDMRPKKAP